MHPRTWQRDHVRMTVLVMQTEPERFQIPLNDNRTLISVSGSLEVAQQRADALSGCAIDCACPGWVECEDHRYRRLG